LEKCGLDEHFVNMDIGVDTLEVLI